VKEGPTGGAEAQEPEAAAGRVGLYFCRCGPNLGQVIRLPDLSEAGGWPGVADVAVHDVLCSAEGKAWLAARIREHGLERVVLGACSPREHEQTFRGVLAGAGRSPHHLQLVNLREQAEWVGGDPAVVTARSRRLVAAALSRVALHRPLPTGEVEVSADVLVVGGGAAGISAALSLAQKGRKVLLAERSFALGGLANQLDEIFPDLECASCFMEPALDRVLHHERIEVLTGAEVRRVRGAAGRFSVELALRPRSVDPAACLGCGACAEVCPASAPDPYAAGMGRRKAIHLAYVGCLPHVSAIDREACLRASGKACDACAAACAFGAVRLDEPAGERSVEVGAIVVATGLRPGPVSGPEGVISSYQLERMLHPNGPTGGKVQGARGVAPRSILLAVAAGEEGDADLAAREILKLALLLRRKVPEAKVTVAGGLHRVPALARGAAELAADGVEFVPGELAPGGISAVLGGLSVRLRSGEIDGLRAAELVVVHGKALPAEGAAELAALLRLEVGADGFTRDRSASPFEPTATRIAGVYVAGAAAGPRPVHQAIRDGAAAAGQILSALVPGERRPLEPLAAEVDEALCGGCGICVSACPFGAIRFQPGSWKAQVEAVHCRGCGTCAAACPTGAASARHFTWAQIAAEISALLAAGA